MRPTLSILFILTLLTAGTAMAQANVSGTHGEVIVDGDATYSGSGVVLRAKDARPSVAARLGASTGKFVVFDTNNKELLFVRHDGNVGIGTSAPRALMHLVRSNSNEADNNAIGPELLLENNGNTIKDKFAITFADSGVLRAQIRTSLDSYSAGGVLTFATGVYTLYDRMIIGSDGNTHIRGSGMPLKVEAMAGSALPSIIEFQDLASLQGVPGGTRMQMFGNSDIRINDLLLGQWNQPVISTVSGADVLVQSRLNVRHLDGNADLAITSGNYPGIHYSPMLKLVRLDGAEPAQRMATFAFWIDPADNHLKLLHGTTDDVQRSTSATAPPLLTIAPATATRAAELTFNGAIVGAVYQDLAEWVPATTDVPPGTVVVLNPARTNEVMASEREYDSRVAGVISAQPGLILGASGEGKEMVATTGRVRVKVDATRPIEVGDLLVSSSRPGMAMKSQPIDLGGVAIHRPGTIIGKALEPLAGGEGEILVLLSLQ